MNGIVYYNFQWFEFDLSHFLTIYLNIMFQVRVEHVDYMEQARYEWTGSKTVFGQFKLVLQPHWLRL